MPLYTRRDVLRITGAASIAALTGCAAPGPGGQRAMGALGNSHARVVVVGGGFGGTIAAKYIKQADPSIRITLVERNRRFISGPFSNAVVAGIKDIDFISHDYVALSDNHDIEMRYDEVTSIDPGANSIGLQSGGSLDYDRLVVSPGVDLRWDGIKGYSRAAADSMPHAWRGTAQIELLKRRLQRLDDGEIVIITVPAAPFSGPSAPYERASLIASYLSVNKPRCKVLLLDGNSDFSNRQQFSSAWEQLYPGMIEWVSSVEGGSVDRVNPVNGMVYSGDQKYKGGLINVIPPQQAAGLARLADLVDDSGWCPVNQKTFESSRHANIHVLGDACIAGEMPKSGFSANTQAKVAAAAVVSYLNGQTPGTPSYLNSCYSLLGPEYGISVAEVYRLGSLGGIEKIHPADTSAAQADARLLEAAYAESWYANISADMFS